MDTPNTESIEKETNQTFKEVLLGLGVGEGCKRSRQITMKKKNGLMCLENH